MHDYEFKFFVRKDDDECIIVDLSFFAGMEDDEGIIIDSASWRGWMMMRV